MNQSVAVLGLLLSASAFATEIETPFSGERPKVFELHAGFAWYGYGIAAGGRFGFPIVHNGFVPSINNSVYINVGVDAYFVESLTGVGRGIALGVPVALQWNFYFTDEWSAFGEAGVNLYLDGDGIAPGYHWSIAAAGGRYRLSERVALQLRVGSPYASFGVEIGL